jgi:hypothetical protein
VPEACRGDQADEVRVEYQLEVRRDADRKDDSEVHQDHQLAAENTDDLGRLVHLAADALAGRDADRLVDRLMEADHDCRLAWDHDSQLGVGHDCLLEADAEAVSPDARAMLLRASVHSPVDSSLVDYQIDLAGEAAGPGAADREQEDAGRARQEYSELADVAACRVRGEAELAQDAGPRKVEFVGAPLSKA